MLSKSYQHFVINYVDNFINFVIDNIQITTIFVPYNFSNNQKYIMKTQEIPAQTKPKSILDMTPFELAMIDQQQNNLRGFKDDEGCDLENVFDWED